MKPAQLHDYQGQPRTLPEIARMVGMKPITLYMRLKRGATLQQAVSAPVARRRSRG